MTAHRRPTRIRSRLAVGVTLVVAAVATVSGLGTPARAAGATYFVATTGADTNSGTSAAAPFRTLQRALDVARPGTTIRLAPGVYQEAVVTKAAGTAAAPITVTGPETGKAVAGRYRAVLVSPAGRAFSINHSHYTLDGFTIDGQPGIGREEYPAALAQVRAFKDSVQARAVNSKLVYVGAADTAVDLTGITISNMFLAESGGECVRFRNRTTNSRVVGSVIQWCGLAASGDDDEQYRYHNAEGVYVGTSPKSITQPYAANDTSNNVVVRDSTVNTFGSECFDVKENAHHNRIESSDCGYNDEPLPFRGSNVEFRGDHNLVLDTRVGQSRSWNVKLASDAPSYDRGGNAVRDSRFSGAAAPAIRSEQSTTGSTFCGNTFTATPTTEGPRSIGDPAAPCPPPAPAAQAVTVEAESGAVGSPMAVRTDSRAQGGRYVSQTSGSSTGRVTVTAPVATAGRYAVALRVVAPNSASDSFVVKVGTGTATTWNLGTRTSWTWVTGPTVALPAGTTTIVVSKRENGARLDALRLTPVP